MADGHPMTKVKNIVLSDPDRRYVVVSAPGKRFSGDIKVTDLLYKCYSELMEHGDCKLAFAAVRKRFEGIVRELGLDFDMASVLDKTEARIDSERSEEFTASRGEYLAAVVMAQLLGAQFIDAEDVIFFDENGAFEDKKSYAAIAAATEGVKLAVIPGFYGRGGDGKIKTFLRGGSGIS